MLDWGNTPLILGSARYPSPQTLIDAISQSQVQVVTVSLRRQTQGEGFWELLQSLPITLLPNTAGCHSAEEAITTAEMAREIFDVPWIKLEVIGDDYSLQPEPFELLRAAQELIKRGFQVLPYCTDDLVLSKRLLDAGCCCLMPWAAPIGSGRGPCNPYALKTLRKRFPNTPLIVDAGLGAPSQACQVMEMGFDAVMVNTAIARASDPVAMAKAFAEAALSGKRAYRAGLMNPRELAEPSTPVLGTPFWHVEKTS